MTEELELIKQIHNEFDTAPARLIKEADEYNSVAKPSISDWIKNKALRLRKLGFSMSTESEILKQHEQETEEDRKVREQKETDVKWVKYYQQNYPFLKFLTITELDRISKKYGLVYAPVSRYIKSVPEKNLLEIERGQPLKLKDMEEGFITYETRMFSFGPSPVTKLEGYEETTNAQKFLEFLDEKESNRKKDGNYDFYSSRIYNLTNKSEFNIAAPADHFDLKGLEKNGFEYRTPLVKNDPIVFKYCKGGILVYSMWGLEASDELAINPINN